MALHNGRLVWSGYGLVTRAPISYLGSGLWLVKGYWSGLVSLRGHRRRLKSATALCSGLNLVPISSQPRPDLVPTSSRSRPDLVPISSRSRRDLVPISSQSCPDLVRVPCSNPREPSALVPISSQSRPNLVKSARALCSSQSLRAPCPEPS